MVRYVSRVALERSFKRCSTGKILPNRPELATQGKLQRRNQYIWKTVMCGATLSYLGPVQTVTGICQVELNI